MDGKGILDFEPHLDINVLPVCPHCGREQTAPWELDLDDGQSTETDCPYCEQSFEVLCTVTVRYSTRPVQTEEE